MVTSNLTITPTPCKRGDVLHFSATISNNPAISTQPGTAYSCSVVLDSTELNPWSTELQTVKYPAPGKTVTVNFTSTYTVPENLKERRSVFMLRRVKRKANKISYKTCIKVVTPIKPMMKQKTTKVILRTNLVCFDFAIKLSKHWNNHFTKTVFRPWTNELLYLLPSLPGEVVKGGVKNNLFLFGSDCHLRSKV